MTREEATKLIGGYATGSLTESERSALLHAAIDDQELFDELAQEQSLKELIDLPGARDRLLAALTPEIIEQPRRTWLPWAAVLSCGLAGITIWALLPKTVEAPQEIATTSTPRVREIPDSIVPTQQPKAIEKVFKEPPSVPKAATPQPAVPQAAATSSPIVADQPLLKTESEEMVRPRISDQSPAITITGSPSNTARVASQVFLVNPADTLQPLTYEFTTNRVLRIVPARPGILEVTMGPQPLFRRNPVVERIPIDVNIPDEAQSVRIEFSPEGGTPYIAIPTVPR